MRTGINRTETALTPNNVRPSTFGKLASFAVQGYVYAQPLYVPNVALSSEETANLLVVATEHNQLYAFDVDSKKTAWHVDFLSSGASTLSPEDVGGCTDLVPEIGITSTPVVDPATQTVYVLVRTKEVVDGTTKFFQRLHAISLRNGQQLTPPKEVTSPPKDYPSTGVAAFDPLLNLQRAALLLVQGQVFVAWASHCDLGGYQGWVMSFDKSTLQTTAYWTPVPYAAGGGIWMSGGGLSAEESGDIFVPVSNSQYTLAGQPPDNYGNSIVRLRWSASAGFEVLDHFTPFNYNLMDDADNDLGSGHALLLPNQPGTLHPHLLVVPDKFGTLYVLDRDNLGKWQPSDNGQVVQTFPYEGFGLASPLFWHSKLYFAAAGDFLKAYVFDSVQQQFNPSWRDVLDYPIESRGATPVVSAYGDWNAVLWMITDVTKGKNAVLHAVDPNNLATELYNSNMSQGDQAGLGVKFSVPTVADGFVFVGAQNQVDMYGLLN